MSGIPVSLQNANMFEPNVINLFDQDFKVTRFYGYNNGFMQLQ